MKCRTATESKITVRGRQLKGTPETPRTENDRNVYREQNEAEIRKRTDA